MENAHDFFRRLHRVCGPNEDEVAAISDQGTLTTRALRPLSKLPQLRAPVLSSTRRPKVTKTKIKKARPLKPGFLLRVSFTFSPPAAKSFGNVRYWHKADIRVTPINVRF